MMLSTVPSSTGLPIRRITTSRTRDPSRKLKLVWAISPIRRTQTEPAMVYAPKKNAARSMRSIPPMVLPSCTSQGRSMNRIPTRAIASTGTFCRSSFSSVKICANTIVKNGLVHMRTATVEALDIMIDSWNRTMLIGMPRVPTPSSCSRSLTPSLTCFCLSSLIANGSRTSPPMANRRNVS